MLIRIKLNLLVCKKDKYIIVTKRVKNGTKFSR